MTGTAEGGPLFELDPGFVGGARVVAATIALLMLEDRGWETPGLLDGDTAADVLSKWLKEKREDILVDDDVPPLAMLVAAFDLAVMMADTMDPAEARRLLTSQADRGIAEYNEVAERRWRERQERGGPGE